MLFLWCRLLVSSGKLEAGIVEMGFHIAVVVKPERWIVDRRISDTTRICDGSVQAC